MMMLKIDTMPAMIAWQTDPMPLTMAIRHAPMVWKTDLICSAIVLANVPEVTMITLAFMFHDSVVDAKWI